MANSSISQNNGSKGSMSNNVSLTDGHAMDWAISENERAKYEKIFNSMSPIKGQLPGNKVKPVLLNSKLPKDTLSRIWDLSDVDKDGNLDKEEFILAMHFVYDCLAKNPLPPSLPQNMVPPSKRKMAAPAPLHFNLQKSRTTSGSTNHTPLVQTRIDTTHPLSKDVWVISPNLKIQFDELFARTDRDKDGFISGMEIKSVFLKSGIPQNTLAKIWSLCDAKSVGKLNCDQFALAMYLVQQKLKGTEPPETLPGEMVPPSGRRKSISDGAPPAGVILDACTSGMKELDALEDDIEKLREKRSILEEQKVAESQVTKDKEAEVEVARQELDEILQAVKQINAQKVEAQKKVDEIDAGLKSINETQVAQTVQYEACLKKKKVPTATLR